MDGSRITKPCSETGFYTYNNLVEGLWLSLCHPSCVWLRSPLTACWRDEPRWPSQVFYHPQCSCSIPGPMGANESYIFLCGLPSLMDWYTIVFLSHGIHLFFTDQHSLEFTTGSRTQSVPPPDAKQGFLRCVCWRSTSIFCSGLLELGSADIHKPEPGESLGRMWLFILLSEALGKPSCKFSRVFCFSFFFFLLLNCFITCLISFPRLFILQKGQEMWFPSLWNMFLVAAGGLPTLFCRLWSKWLSRAGLTPTPMPLVLWSPTSGHRSSAWLFHLSRPAVVESIQQVLAVLGCLLPSPKA